MGQSAVRFFGATTLVITMCLSSWAIANPLCPEKPIRLAHYEMGSLYSKGAGIDEEIAREMAQRSHCQFEYSVRPRARIWVELEHGDTDMALSAIQTSARDQFAWFAHYIQGKNLFLLQPRLEVTSMQAFMDNPKLKLGVVRIYKYSPFYDPLVEKLRQENRLVEAANMEQLYLMFKAKRFDATLSFAYVSPFYLKKFSPKEQPRVVDWDPGAVVPQGLVLSKKSFSAKQAKAWKILMNEMLDDGTVLRILKRHMDANSALQAVYQPILSQ